MTRRPEGSVLRRLREDDSGVTLVELLVYGIVLAVVLAVVGGLLVNALRTHGAVRDRAQASDTVQVGFGALERSVRNAGGGFVDDSGRLLVLRERTAKSVTDADRWRCVGYYVDEASGDLRRVLDPTGSQTAAALAAADAATVASGWPVLVGEATRIGSVPPFGPADGPLNEHRTVDISLRALAGAQKPVDLVTTATLRPQSGSTLTCW